MLLVSVSELVTPERRAQALARRPPSCRLLLSRNYSLPSMTPVAGKHQFSGHVTVRTPFTCDFVVDKPSGGQRQAVSPGLVQLRATPGIPLPPSVRTAMSKDASAVAWRSVGKHPIPATVLGDYIRIQGGFRPRRSPDFGPSPALMVAGRLLLWQ